MRDYILSIPAFLIAVGVTVGWGLDHKKLREMEAKLEGKAEKGSICWFHGLGSTTDLEYFPATYISLAVGTTNSFTITGGAGGTTDSTIAGQGSKTGW